MEKNYTSYLKRIYILKDRGLNIPLEQKSIIKNYNYYNLVNGYKEPFLEHVANYPSWADRQEDFFKNGTEPLHIKKLYEFDEKLRMIFLKRLLKIEDEIKDMIVQSFYEYHSKDNDDIKLHRENEYLKRSYYNLNKSQSFFISEKSGFRYSSLSRLNRNDTMRHNPKAYTHDRDKIYYTSMTNIYRSIGQQRRKNKAIESYLDKHTYLPMWVLTNILTFGNVSKLFEIQHESVQEAILKKFDIRSKSLTVDMDILNFSRVLHILSIFRNMCAHSERLYCSKIYTPIDDDFMNFIDKTPYSNDIKRLKGTNRFLTNEKYQKLQSIRSGIYTLMFCVSLFLNEKELKDFKKDIEKELVNLKKVLQRTSYEKSLALMGLSFGWKKLLIK